MIHETTFRNLILNCMSAHIEEIMISGEKIREMKSARLKENEMENFRRCLQKRNLFVFLLYSNVIQQAIVSSFLNKSITYKIRKVYRTSQLFQGASGISQM